MKATIIRVVLDKDILLNMQIDGHCELKDVCLSVERLEMKACTRCGKHPVYKKQEEKELCEYCYKREIDNFNAAYDEAVSCGYL